MDRATQKIDMPAGGIGDFIYTDEELDILEVKELEEAESLDERKSEIGDVLFAIVNVCRYLDADPEIQLNKSTQRFIKRAQYVEKHIRDDSDLEKLWVEAKKTED